MNFADAARKSENSTNWTYTENGAKVQSTTFDNMLDLFGIIGSMRSRTQAEIEEKFKNAFSEDKLLAVKMAFYARNCRGGLGERRTFHIILRWLANTYPEIVINNMDNIPYFGRWDDLYTLVGTKCEKEMWQLIRFQWVEDGVKLRKEQPISIMAKWLKSVNTSSNYSRILGKKTANALGLTEKQYRKNLSTFREYLNICERKMSRKEWSQIIYSEVPSYAMKRYRNAFVKNDTDRFTEYRNSLQKKLVERTITSKDIKSTTLYPMDIVKSYINNSNSRSYWGLGRINYDTILEAQWTALPNYINKSCNILVMADVSGSMYINHYEPLSASIGLATYFAQRNKGYYHNLYMTFSEKSSFISIKENESLNSIINKVAYEGMGYNTNLEKAFDYILTTAIENNISNDELPKALVVVSDMQIDPYMRGRGLNFIQSMTNKFKKYGYTLPKLVLWNVEARKDTYLADKFSNATFVSGFSASTFRDIIHTLDMNPIDSMLKILNNPIYDRVIV